MIDGSDTRRDQYLKSANRNPQSETWEDSRGNTGELSPAEHVAVSEFLSKVSER
jgi:hypothetical protein